MVTMRDRVLSEKAHSHLVIKLSQFPQRYHEPPCHPLKRWKVTLADNGLRNVAHYQYQDITPGLSAFNCKKLHLMQFLCQKRGFVKVSQSAFCHLYQRREIAACHLHDNDNWCHDYEYFAAGAAYKWKSKWVQEENLSVHRWTNSHGWN